MKRLFPITLMAMLILTLTIAGCGGSGGGGTLTPPSTPPGPATVYAFDRAWGSSGYGDGQFNLPRGIAIDAANNIYVTDSGNYRVQVFDTNGNYKTQWGDPSLFESPNGIAIDSNGNIYVADTQNGYQVQKLNNSNNNLVYLGNLLTNAGSNVCLAVDKDGNIYVTYMSLPYFWITKFMPNQATPVWQQQMSANPFTSYGIAVDANNNLYVTDYTHNCIRKYNAATGEFVTQWGSKGNNPGQFSDPYGVAVDGDGYIYVVEFNNNRVQKFKPDGTFLCQWGSYGSGDGQFSLPSAIAVDTAGNVYVVDSGNNRIQKFKPVR
jgi:tripartite motif-containing protein 71